MTTPVLVQMTAYVSEHLPRTAYITRVQLNSDGDSDTCDHVLTKKKTRHCEIKNKKNKTKIFFKTRNLLITNRWRYILKIINRIFRRYTYFLRYINIDYRSHYIVFKIIRTLFYQRFIEIAPPGFLSSNTILLLFLNNCSILISYVYRNDLPFILAVLFYDFSNKWPDTRLGTCKYFLAPLQHPKDVHSC